MSYSESYLCKLEREVEEKQNEIKNIKEAILVARKIIDKKMNYNLVLRAQAFLKDVLDEKIENKRIGYDLMQTHEGILSSDKRGWISSLTDEEFLSYRILVKSFDEVNFIMYNTKYDEYADGQFFRRS